ncbi:MAG TPA: sterol desaturase family protein [Puia sp.]|uniref:sterol desaturase family protein n=1 Tax=Puia sp. TaxID=2045100 RepID=UPI002CB57915|nr:sterol desaturase family protein [Puia sp.]HVU98584.1 sterol desaturase family protein [Puia sp.]
MGTIVYYTTAALVISVFVFVWLERRFPYTKGIPVFRDGFWVDLIWYTFIQSYFLKILIFGYLIEPMRRSWHLESMHWLDHWPVALQVLLFLVIHDFYIYWFHRAQHHSKLLWRTHEAHHSNKEVDWLAGTRSHVVEIIINQTIEFAPIVLLLGPDSPVVPIKALIDAVWGMYIHSNIDVRSGKLQYFINGPEMHQWHHANDRAVFYANYSTKFAMWDWIFGTAYLPGRKKPAEYGLYYDYPKDYFLQHWFSVKRIDERKWVERYPWFRAYYHSRRRVWQWMLRKFGIGGTVAGRGIGSERTGAAAEGKERIAADGEAA